jgi:hypothetical protein
LDWERPMQFVARLHTILRPGGFTLETDPDCL